MRLFQSILVVALLLLSAGGAWAENNCFFRVTVRNGMTDMLTVLMETDAGSKSLVLDPLKDGVLTYDFYPDMQRHSYHATLRLVANSDNVGIYEVPMTTGRHEVGVCIDSIKVVKQSTNPEYDVYIQGPHQMQGGCRQMGIDMDVTAVFNK